MLWTLAQLDPESTAAKWLIGVSSIMVIGAITVLIIVVAGVGRRWKRRQLNAIEQDKADRRAGKTGDRIDAWAASSERYVDHDKLAEDDEPFERRKDTPDEEPSDARPASLDEDNPDPFGLFHDKPYQEPEDSDDDFGDEDDDDDWDDNEEKW